MEWTANSLVQLSPLMYLITGVLRALMLIASRAHGGSVASLTSLRLTWMFRKRDPELSQQPQGWQRQQVGAWTSLPSLATYAGSGDSTPLRSAGIPAQP